MAAIQKTANGLVVPIVHLNGTGQRGLSAPLEDTVNHLYKAKEALAEGGPNMRDYYPYGPEGEVAYATALGQHRARLGAIEALIEQLAELTEGIDNAANGRPVGG